MGIDATIARERVRANGIEPDAYLSRLFAELQWASGADHFEALLPLNLKAENRTINATGHVSLFSAAFLGAGRRAADRTQSRVRRPRCTPLPPARRLREMRHQPRRVRDKARENIPP
jgi:hypothetical protein